MAREWDLIPREPLTESVCDGCYFHPSICHNNSTVLNWQWQVCAKQCRGSRTGCRRTRIGISPDRPTRASRPTTSDRRDSIVWREPCEEVVHDVQTVHWSCVLYYCVEGCVTSSDPRLTRFRKGRSHVPYCGYTDGNIPEIGRMRMRIIDYWTCGADLGPLKWKPMDCTVGPLRAPPG